MPRPGEVRSPSYQQAGELPKGAAQQANQAMPSLAMSIFGGAGDVQDEEPEQFASTEESFLFSASDRPDEPVTAGHPFGAGPDFTSRGYESPDELKRRVVLGMLKRPGAPPEVIALAKRVARGE